MALPSQSPLLFLSHLGVFKHWRVLGLSLWSSPLFSLHHSLGGGLPNLYRPLVGPQPWLQIHTFTYPLSTSTWKSTRYLNMSKNKLLIPTPTPPNLCKGKHHLGSFSDQKILQSFLTSASQHPIHQQILSDSTKSHHPHGYHPRKSHHHLSLELFF